MNLTVLGVVIIIGQSSASDLSTQGRTLYRVGLAGMSSLVLDDGGLLRGLQVVPRRLVRHSILIPCRLMVRQRPVKASIIVRIYARELARPG